MERTDICGRITDRNLAITTIANVLLHIPCDGFDIWGGVAGGNIVDELVSGVEKEGIVVF